MCEACKRANLGTEPKEFVFWGGNNQLGMGESAEEQDEDGQWVGDDSSSQSHATIASQIKI